MTFHLDHHPPNSLAHRPLKSPTMALPKTLVPSLTPDELTFLAEDEVIQIVPLFSMSKIRLLSVSRASHELNP